MAFWSTMAFGLFVGCLSWIKGFFITQEIFILIVFYWIYMLIEKVYELMCEDDMEDQSDANFSPTIEDNELVSVPRDNDTESQSIENNFDDQIEELNCDANTVMQSVEDNAMVLEFIMDDMMHHLQEIEEILQHSNFSGIRSGNNNAGESRSLNESPSTKNSAYPNLNVESNEVELEDHISDSNGDKANLNCNAQLGFHNSTNHGTCSLSEGEDKCISAENRDSDTGHTDEVNITGSEYSDKGTNAAINDCIESQESFCRSTDIEDKSIQNQTYSETEKDEENTYLNPCATNDTVTLKELNSSVFDTDAPIFKENSESVRQVIGELKNDILHEAEKFKLLVSNSDAFQNICKVDQPTQSENNILECRTSTSIDHPVSRKRTSSELHREVSSLLEQMQDRIESMNKRFRVIEDSAKSISHCLENSSTALDTTVQHPDKSPHILENLQGSMNSLNKKHATLEESGNNKICLDSTNDLKGSYDFKEFVQNGDRLSCDNFNFSLSIESKNTSESNLFDTKKIFEKHSKSTRTTQPNFSDQRIAKNITEKENFGIEMNDIVSSYSLDNVPLEFLYSCIS